jgi:Domain of unknown function (DUF3576)
MNHLLTIRTACILGALLIALPACSVLKPDEQQNYPKTEEDRRKAERGKITGEEGLAVGGTSEKDKDSGKNPLGVNSFLWRATLDTLSFLPITSADPFGGTVLTEWYEAPEAPGERFKVNVLILDRQLRADSLKITTFRQTKTKAGVWADVPTDAKLGRKLEDTVLTRARELRVKQLGY